MASFRDLEMDWSMLCQECPDCWTGEDLQLAAELGKTLLERNKELELAIKQHQNVIEDQAQEIEYLTKQTVALREVSDSRLRIYEQLEVSIQDLERANHRLVLDNSAGKKHVKTLSATIETLEIKCEELQSTIDDLRLQVDVLRRKAQRSTESQVPQSNPIATVHLRHVERHDHEEDEEAKISRDREEDERRVDRKPCTPRKKTESVDEDALDDTMEQVSQLLAQLREARTQSGRDQRRMTELEEQLATMSQQNRALEEQVIKLHYQKGDEMKSINEELSTLEEVRKGEMCSRCLRSVDSSDIPEDDDSSMYEELNQHRSSFHMDVQAHSSPAPNNGKDAPNLYQDLAKKYQAYIDVRNKQKRQVSLQEELSGVSLKDTDEESGNGDSLKPEQILHPKARTQFSHTPTDFSEAETSSSGFSDETSNKYTQTDDSPGSFLCKIADESEDSLSNRFKSQPEYQKLFKDIITVLKNTEQIETPTMAESKPILANEGPISRLNHGEDLQLMLLGDDDSQSVVSSTMSELSMSQNEPTTIIEDLIQSQNQPIPEPEVLEQTSASRGGLHQERILRPLIRQPLDYLQISASKRSGSRRKGKHQAERSDSPVTHIIGSPKINFSSRPNSARKRRDTARVGKDENSGESGWNGSTVQFYASNRGEVASPTPSQGSGRFEFKPSSASHDLHKLKSLDMSYAEVLRNPDPKNKPRHHNNNRRYK